jgi:hypothetical protein
MAGMMSRSEAQGVSTCDYTVLLNLANGAKLLERPRPKDNTTMHYIHVGMLDVGPRIELGGTLFEALQKEIDNDTTASALRTSWADERKGWVDGGGEGSDDMVKIWLNKLKTRLKGEGSNPIKRAKVQVKRSEAQVAQQLANVPIMKACGVSWQGTLDGLLTVCQRRHTDSPPTPLRLHPTPPLTASHTGRVLHPQWHPTQGECSTSWA